MIEITQKQIMHDWPSEYNVPLVSIRCITYNHEPYIAQTLDGFLMQKTNFPFEIIVHDDASTDKTADIIRIYEKKYPQIVKPIYEIENQYSKRDGSLSRIVDAAVRGKYIALCEGDDFWIDENKLQKQVDFLEVNDDYGLCYTNFKIQKTTNELLEKQLKKEYQNFNGPNKLKEWLSCTPYVGPMTWLIRKSLWVDYRKFSFSSVDGTYVAFTYFLSKTRIKCFKNDETAVYRILAESASHSKNIKNAYNRKKSLFSLQKKLIRIFLSTKDAEEIYPLICRKYYNRNLRLIATFSDVTEIRVAFHYVDNKIQWLFFAVLAIPPISNLFRWLWQKRVDFAFHKS